MQLGEYQTKKYWIIAPGEAARKWDEFYDKGIIGIGWDEMGDLNKYDSRANIKDRLIVLYPEGSKSQKNNSLALWEFAKEMKIGDILIPKRGNSEYLGYGVVKGEYYFDDTRKEYMHLREVDWKKKGVWPEEFAPIVTKTLTDVTKYPDYVNRLKRLIGIEQEAVIPNQVNYWWINANPKYWKITDFEVGQEQTYSTHNEKGNKRSRYEYFKQIKPGDLALGYASSPIQKVIAVFEITKGAYIDEDDGTEKVSFIIQKFLPEPIGWEELLLLPEFESSEMMKNNQGSLFKLSKEAFNAILIKDFKRFTSIEEYTLEDALKEIFIEKDELERILFAIEYKKNIILQGPPGTGKTFMAKRLAYLILEEKDKSKVEMIQFHQSYSYEDFIQGYRPVEDGSFKLINGIFYRFCKKAQADPDHKYFIIIDEINRGNLSKIFGELMLLIEADKRGPDFGVTLTYSDNNENKFFIPSNVYLIGTMNTADRSLAVVDYALRRRFAFITILPNFNSKFKNDLINKGVDEGIVIKIIYKIGALNQEIAKDQNLKWGFQIGHSYFCNVPEGTGDEEWYQQIIQNEIEPLLNEYWFDNEEKAGLEITRLKI
jgi:5-methylcytosine-specific restriction enzyme B